MPRIVWAPMGERFYEMGVDRGVLYTQGNPGVPWSGLVSITESNVGGEPKPYYIDGVKYLNLASAEEFEATITAFHKPPEFEPCDGILSIHNGLFATQQPRRQFGLSYRTKIGNDLRGIDYAYKIHLVYNALASPTEKPYATFSNSSEPPTLSWPITTLPPAITGFKRTSHLVIDSRYTDTELLTSVEDILYGDDENAARLPDPDELIEMFSDE